MTVERLLDDAALDAAAAAVNEAQRAETARVRGRDVLLDHRRDILRRERVQIELRLDGKFEGIVGHGVHWRRDDSATTVVVMPPRAVKAPVTVMRRGWHAATRSSRILFVAAS